MVVVFMVPTLPVDARSTSTSSSPGTSAQLAVCDGGLGPLPPPPNPLKQKAPSLSGRTDLSVPFTHGLIRVRVRCGQSIDRVMTSYRIPGKASPWSPPPFDAHDIRAGLDRSFRITVPVGEEKAWVTRLATKVEFEWVQLDWRFPVAVSGVPGKPVSRPLALTTNDPYLSGGL